MKMLPQYSIRLMLGITALAAVVFSVAGLAVRGHGWAIGITLGVVGCAVALVTYGVFFAILWGFSVVASPVMNRRGWVGERALAGTASPFGEASGALAKEQPIEAIVVEAEAGDGGNEGTMGGGR